MSSIYLTRTNQKLNFARIHLEALKDACNSSEWSKHALIESYNESLLFHLASGYGALLREIAERYNLDAARINGFRALQGDMESTGQECSELNELSVLEEDSSSWLFKMLAAYDACWMATDKKRAPSASVSMSEIHVAQVNPDYTDESGMLIEYQLWLTELRQLVERLREGMQEW